jgi:hypothetical protein
MPVILLYDPIILASASRFHRLSFQAFHYIPRSFHHSTRMSSLTFLCPSIFACEQRSCLVYALAILDVFIGSLSNHNERNNDTVTRLGAWL